MDNAVSLEDERYKLLDVIGRGGMGIVYRAMDKKVGRTVAIKMLLKEYGGEKNLVERFFREVCFTANFNHRNIVTVFTFEDFRGSPCMVMEYLDGQSIAELIKSARPVPIVEKIGLAIQVCDGLHYAHERAVIHRDIKPANVLVLKDGLAKIVDFGIARSNADHTLTLTGQAIGSLPYMSPEQLSGGPIDARTDIYSAGVTLFEFLTGKVPFKGADGNVTSAKILNEPVPSLGKYLAGYPTVLDEILQKAMAKSADERYQTAEDLGYDLSRLQETLKRGMAQEFLMQAKLAIDRKDWEVARQQLQEIRKFDKQLSEANELLKLVGKEIQKQQKSVQIAQLRSQAQVALAGRQFEEALECIEQACRLDPGDDDLNALSQSIQDRVKRTRALAEALRRGQAALYAGDLKEAELAVMDALEAEPDNSEVRALANLVRKESEGRIRRAQLQGFVEVARREIANHNFLSALHSLERAHAIDPSDSNVRELAGWASRGHEQSKRRTELQEWTLRVDELMGQDSYAEVIEACKSALQKFPDEPSFLKLQQLAARQLDLVQRRSAVDAVSSEVHRLADEDRNEEAEALIKRALQSFPGEANLETLLAMTLTELERKRRAAEEHARTERAHPTRPPSTGSAPRLENAASAAASSPREDEETGSDQTMIFTRGPGAAEEDTSQLVKHTAFSSPLKRGRLVAGYALAAVALVGGSITAFLLAPRTVTVRTDPPGATVTVDGQVCGDAPCIVKLRVGKHELRGTRSGFEGLRQQIAIPWFGANLPIFALKPVPPPAVSEREQLPPVPDNPMVQESRIIISSSISRASVFIDGAKAGKTDQSGSFELSVAPGAHQVRIEKSGLIALPSQVIQVAEGAEAILTFNPQQASQNQTTPPAAANLSASAPAPSASLRAPQGQPAGPSTPGSAQASAVQPSVAPLVSTAETYLVLTAPTGAEVHIDQQFAGHSTGGPFKNKVQPGMRTVEIFLAGYQPWKQTVSVDPGKENELIATLTPVPADIVAPNPPAPPSVSPSSALPRVSSGLFSSQGVRADSGAQYLRLSLAADSAADPSQGDRQSSPAFTIECTQLHDHRMLSLFVNFGRSNDSRAFAAPYPAVSLKMTFEGYMRTKPFKRSWQQLPDGSYKYRQPGMGSPNLEDPRYFLQALNALPDLRIVRPNPELGKPGELIFHMAPMVQQILRAPLCQP